MVTAVSLNGLSLAKSGTEMLLQLWIKIKGIKQGIMYPS